jgi:selenocysteine lyase/cysteine desulfurase
MTDRRKFLKQLGIGAGATLAANYAQAALLEGLEAKIKRYEHFSPEALAADEVFWRQIQNAYATSPKLINLNNGGVSPAPKPVQDVMKQYYDLCNQAPSFYMWRILDKGREPLRKRLAAMAGCAPEEVALQRNASEALETVIFGVSLQPGDEVVLCRQDYPNMVESWKQRELRDGIKLVWVDLQLPSEDENYLVDSYVARFTPKTKLVQVTHMINWVGQLLPVRRIADAARQRGIEVLVDGAHTFAQFPFAIPDLGCDYFGTSLHKWLGAPIGTGMLYVKKEKIGPLYPLFGSGNPTGTDIKKFEHLGTRPFFIEQAIDKAIDFTEMIGLARKQARLQYLKNYWMEKVRHLPGVSIHTSLNPQYACAIGMFSVAGHKPSDVEVFLMDNYKVHTVAIEWQGIKGLRVTPNVYITTKQLDKLVDGVKHFVGR